MKKCKRCLICIFMFPVDFFRFTVDAWQLTLEGLSHRIFYKNKDQPCIYCRDMDCGYAPRPMHAKIRYWNLWLVKLLHPELVTLEPRRGIRKVPMCMKEGGYVYTPVYLPLVAIISSLLWLALLLWLLWITETIPPHQLAAS